MKLELHEKPSTDKILKRIVLITSVVIGLGLSAGTIRGCANDIDEGWTTHQEVHEIDNASMYLHKEELNKQHFATTTDINHIINIMLEEQIDDATLEIEKIEFLEERDAANEKDLAEKAKLEKAIEKSRSKLEPDGHDHGHE